MNLTSTIIRFSIFFCFGLLGVFAAGQHSEEPTSTQEPAVAKAEAGRFVQEDSGKFVQESGPRSSYKPPFARSRPTRLSNARNNFLMMRAFQEAVGTSWMASVQILSADEQVSLGAVVAPDGWIITKASQVGDRTVTCRLYDNRKLPAEVVRRVPNHDLALLKIDAENLPTVQWQDSLPRRGSWLATVDLKKTPRSVGVMSAGSQRVPGEAPVLGVLLEGSTSGAKVKHVLPGTGAEIAGLKLGDFIFEVNGKNVRDLTDFKHAIADYQGGQFIHMRVSRESLDRTTMVTKKKELTVDARLMDLTEELLDETEMEVNGQVSARATGFDEVFLHDTVLKPNQCGGPVVNLNGQVVGINIARAGRVTSYALPTSVVKPMVQSLIDQAKLVSRRSDDASPIR